MRKTTRVAVAVVFALIIAFQATAQTRREMIVSTDWLAERLDGKVIVIEVGEKAEYDKGHIPAARLLERSSLLVDVDGIPNELPPLADLETLFTQLGIGDSKRVVLYSRQPLLATRAWFTLDYLGHGHRASVLNGGYGRWTAEGRPSSSDTVEFAPAPISVRANRATVTSHAAVKILVRSRAVLGESLVVVDARPPANYEGKTAGNGVARAGHVPGAVNVPWVRNLSGDTDDALFLDDDALRALYPGVSRVTTVITYCRTGVEASLTYFVLRYLGFDPALYDGSFVEWTKDRKHAGGVMSGRCHPEPENVALRRWRR